MKDVYIIFEKKLYSCDRDYGDDGFVIVWDSEEFCRNVSGKELVNLIRDSDECYYNAIKDHIKEDFDLNIDDDFVDEYLNEIIDFMTNETQGIFYRFHYQEIPVIREVHSTEEKAKGRVDYFKNNISYDNDYFYSKYRVH